MFLHITLLRGKGRALAEMIMFMSSLTVEGWIIFGVILVATVCLFTIIKRNQGSFIQRRIKWTYKHVYGKYDFYIMGPSQIHHISLVLLFLLIPSLPNTYVESERALPAPYLFYMFAVMFFIVVCFSIRSSLIVFFENKTTVYPLCGFGKLKEFSPHIYIDGDIENINPLSSIPQKSRKAVVLKTKEGTKIAKIHPNTCEEHAYNRLLVKLEDSKNNF